MAQVNSAIAEILGSYKPRWVRDKKVIRDTAFGFNPYYRYEINLLDSPLLQRLRNIHQTSLAFFTYPSAVHTRFEHSLGVTVLVDRMIEAIRTRDPALVVNPASCAEVRLAALLHDVGHCPFSHGSEQVYGSFDEIERVKEENPGLFKKRDPHEILSYFIVTSEKFAELWKEIIQLYTPREIGFPLSDVKLINVALMILGQHPNPEMKFFAQMVNGPHDADKFDYITRDGYFTGLRTAIDIDRFLLSLSTHVVKQTGERQLCVDMSGVTALEQLLFNKMQLYSSVYHHQKVRAALQAFISIFELYGRKSLNIIRGLDFRNAVDFLRIDEHDILNKSHPDPDFAMAISGLRNRILPMRALVLCSDSVVDELSRFNLSRMREEKGKIEELRRDIAEAASEHITDVLIDFPEEPKFLGTAFESLVRTSPEHVIHLNDVFPVAAWVRGHAEHRYRVYVFCKLGSEEKVAKAAYQTLRKEKYGIKPNEMALYLANHTPQFVASLRPGNS